MSLKLLFGSIMVILFFNGCVAATENLSSAEKEDLVPRTPITPRTPDLGLYIESDIVHDKPNNSENPKILNNLSIVENFPREKIETNPLLSKPKIAKIKIKSYIDTDGDYHEPSTIHMIIKESRFIEEKKYFSIHEK
ncbi:TraV family lipoprotein [Sulfurimonas sp.]|uniref:TraV family lipoprotein n=1 Tax=Sulfurimonas sp. TaxID=2022749 RepID=UPI0025EF69E2|nr:TraV family lipoprotein [Sulfurimonas sp.]MCK9473674.1 TraV family lipoprotein [Sulfurimonas sp.]